MKVSEIHTIRQHGTYLLDETLSSGHREPCLTLFPEGQLSLAHRTTTVKNESNFTDTAWC